MGTDEGTKLIIKLKCCEDCVEQDIEVTVKNKKSGNKLIVQSFRLVQGAHKTPEFWFTTSDDEDQGVCICVRVNVEGSPTEQKIAYKISIFKLFQKYFKIYLVFQNHNFSIFVFQKI